MLTTSARRLLAAALLASLALGGCSPARPAASLQPTTAVIAPTTAPAAPTTAPAAPAPALGKLPALDNPAWLELARADLDGDGGDERLLYLYGQQVEPRQGFGDPYLAGKAMMADVVVVAESDGTVALQLDPTGARADGAELWSFPAEAPVGAFTIAVEAEEPLRLVGLPLAASGLQQGGAFLIAWDAAAGAYRAEPIAYDGLITAPPGDQALLSLDVQEQAAVSAGALAHLRAAAPGQPAVAGALAQAGGYAVAEARVFGEEASRTLYLRRDGGGWAVVLDTVVPGAAQLEAAGVPLSLAQPDARRDALLAAEAHLQDPRGQGVDGSLVIEAFADSFARVVFLPTDRDRYDSPTMFFAGTQSGWQLVTAGTAFTAADYETLRIPASVR